MSRPYPPQSPLPPLPPYRPYASAPTERLDDPEAGAARYGEPGGRHRSWEDRAPGESSYRDWRSPGARPYRDGYGSERYGTDDYDADYDAEDYDAYVDGEPPDRRWAWIAGAAGAILLVAVICTAVILGGGDSGSVSATVGAPAPSRAPVTTSAAPEPSAAAPPAAALPPETITTVTPTRPSTPAPSATAAAPAPLPSTAPAPPAAAANPRAVTYTVNGANQLIDLVTVIYTDQQGALKTDVNVALPWSKTIVLDPGVQLKSVTATSVGGQLTCAITDATGATLVAQTNASMIATCTQ